MTDSAGLLRPTVHRVVREIVQQVGIYSPQIDVKFASKNGDSYSGEVYRVVVRPSEDDLQDEADNNTDDNNNNPVKWVDQLLVFRHLFRDNISIDRSKCIMHNFRYCYVRKFKKTPRPCIFLLLPLLFFLSHLFIYL